MNKNITFDLLNTIYYVFDPYIRKFVSLGDKNGR